MNESPQIFKLLSEVMKDVGAVRKAERNTHQNFNFRGIDAVVNAASPALRAHGVIVFPQLISSEYELVQIGQNRTQMGYARIIVKYVFAAPDGSTVETTVPAESMDSGDKATAKAMSVAFRTALLQTLCLPTDDGDPDLDTFERSPAQSAQQPTAYAPRKEPTQVKAATQFKPQHEQRTRVGSAASPPSDAQTRFVKDLLVKTNADESLIEDAWQTTIAMMTGAQAKQIIDALLRVQKGEAEIVMNDAGKFAVV
jgi:hypothetical protein